MKERTLSESAKNVNVLNVIPRKKKRTLSLQNHKNILHAHVQWIMKEDFRFECETASKEKKKGKEKTFIT